MQISDAKGTHKVVLRKTIAAPRETLFDLWAFPEHLRQWLSPSADVELFLAEVDFRADGRYRFGFRSGDGIATYVGGTYLEIMPPERLVFTWTPEPPDVDAGKKTLVTVDFRDNAGQTEIVLVHERFPDKAMCDRHNEGWNGALEQLERMPFRSP